MLNRTGSCQMCVPPPSAITMQVMAQVMANYTMHSKLVIDALEPITITCNSGKNEVLHSLHDLYGLHRRTVSYILACIYLLSDTCLCLCPRVPGRTRTHWALRNARIIFTISTPQEGQINRDFKSKWREHSDLRVLYSAKVGVLRLAIGVISLF